MFDSTLTTWSLWWCCLPASHLTSLEGEKSNFSEEAHIVLFCSDSAQSTAAGHTENKDINVICKPPQETKATKPQKGLRPGGTAKNEEHPTVHLPMHTET